MFSKHFTNQRVVCLRLAIGMLAVSLVCSNGAYGQDMFERPPIQYSAATPHDSVAKIQSRLDERDIELKFDESRGYLDSVLAALDISPTTQTLVFSKTSLQMRRISPATPRALYFNDDTYVGWVPDGDVIEVSTADPNLGAVFYTLQQVRTERPKFVRDQGNCLTCHASSRTRSVPGHLMRSVYPSPSGQPHYGAGTFNTNQNSPFEKRWGGWYVTGTHGDQRHMGNEVARNRVLPELDTEAGANVTDLTSRFRAEPYISEHSDIVALMVLAHQIDMHNLITFANFEARSALHHDGVMNKALERPADHVSESTQRRIEASVEKLVRYMLFADEAKLADRVEGTPEFAKHFTSQGPRDSRGRSLRDLDLESRLFKYPCSFLIYSESFRALPSQAKQAVYQRLHEVLWDDASEISDSGSEEGFEHLSSSDRLAIRQILLETNPEAAAAWKRPVH